jgi:hypothetical protein
VKALHHFGFRAHVVAGLGAALIAGVVLVTSAPHTVTASPPFGRVCHGTGGDELPCDWGDEGLPSEGTWYWLRSPDQEKRVVAGLFNFYCARCHGADGRGIWDIPGVPNFTNVRWQASRSDAQRARIILEGRGAVMPPFRGALTLEEAWAIGRYLRTLVPGTETPRPDFGSSPKTDGKTELPRPTPVDPLKKAGPVDLELQR